MKKILFFISFLFLFSINNVNATTYTLENRNTNFYFYPSSSSPSITNNQLYYNGNANDFLYHMDIGLNTISSDRDDKNNNVFNGRYFIDFYIFGVGTFPNIPCWSLTEVRAQYLNKTDAVWYSMPISCVDTYKTTYKGYNAIRILFEFTYKDIYGSDGMSELNFIINKTDGFIRGGSTGLNYGYNFGSIQTYNQQILDDFINLKNQNDLINSDKVTQDKLDNIDDSITSESPPTKLDNLSNSAGWLPAGPVDSILNLPLTMFQNLSNNIGSSCTPLDINLPYVDENITLPCLNSIYEQIDGLSVWINSIGTIASAFILYSYLLKLYKWVDDTLTFRENNHIDNWGGI